MADECSRDLVECWLCKKAYEDPRSLQCCHAFCLECLVKEYDDKQPGDEVACPICDEKFTLPYNGVQALPKNLFMSNMTDIAKVHMHKTESPDNSSVSVSATETQTGATLNVADLLKTIDAEPTMPEEEKDRCRQAVKDVGMIGFIKSLANAESKWKTMQLNIGVIGSSGVGKSSFINAVRGIDADAEGSAPVGVKECTVKVTPYAHPDNPLFLLWDLPGVGTDRFKKDVYLDTIKVERYDFFLLLSAERFTEIDTWLGQQITYRSKKYFYVRTKISHDVEDDRKAHSKSHNQETVISTIREDIVANLADKETKVFLIDNFETKKFDFPLLVVSLVKDFPELKRSALLLSMEPINEEMAKMKEQELKSQRWKETLLNKLGENTAVGGLLLAGLAAGVMIALKFK